MCTTKSHILSPSFGVIYSGLRHWQAVWGIILFEQNVAPYNQYRKNGAADVLSRNTQKLQPTDSLPLLVLEKAVKDNLNVKVVLQ